MNELANQMAVYGYLAFVFIVALCVFGGIFGRLYRHVRAWMDRRRNPLRRVTPLSQQENTIQRVDNSLQELGIRISELGIRTQDAHSALEVFGRSIRGLGSGFPSSPPPPPVSGAAIPPSDLEPVIAQPGLTTEAREAHRRLAAGARNHASRIMGLVSDPRLTKEEASDLLQQFHKAYGNIGGWHNLLAERYLQTASETAKKKEEWKPRPRRIKVNKSQNHVEER